MWNMDPFPELLVVAALILVLSHYCCGSATGL